MNKQERKEVREVDRVVWVKGFPSLTLEDRKAALPVIGKRTGKRMGAGITRSTLLISEIYSLVQFHVESSTEVVDQAIQNMMNPIDLSGE